jgi:hypothetical protein
MNHGDIPIDPGEDRDGYLIARNSAVTDARLARIAAGFVGATTDHKDVLRWVAAVLEDPTEAPWLYLCGPVGTGKTHAAVAALRLAIRVPRAVRWELTTLSGLHEARRLAQGRRNRGDDEGAQAALYERADLLVLDDLGMVRESNDWALEELWRLVDYRRRNWLPTIFTANFPTASLRTHFSEQIESRVMEHCIVVSMTGEDRRRAPHQRRPRPTPAPPPPDTPDRRTDVKELLARFGAELPPGRPDQLRYGTAHWERLRRRDRQSAEPLNPAYLDRIARGQ